MCKELSAVQQPTRERRQGVGLFECNVDQTNNSKIEIFGWLVSWLVGWLVGQLVGV